MTVIYVVTETLHYDVLIWHGPQLWKSFSFNLLLEKVWTSKLFLKISFQHMEQGEEKSIN